MASQTLVTLEERLRDDLLIVQAAVKGSGWALKFASCRLQLDCTLATSAIRKYPYVLRSLPNPHPCRDDEALMREVVDEDPCLFNEVSDTLRNNFEFVKRGCRVDGGR